MANDCCIVTFRSMQKIWRTGRRARSPERSISRPTSSSACQRFSASLHAKTFAASDDADHQSHERRLDDTDFEMGDRYGIMQPRDEDRRLHAAIEPCYQPTTIERGH